MKKEKTLMEKVSRVTAKILRYDNEDKVLYEHSELVRKMQATSRPADMEHAILKILLTEVVKDGVAARSKLAAARVNSSPTGSTWRARDWWNERPTEGPSHPTRWTRIEDWRTAEPGAHGRTKQEDPGR